MNYLPYALVIIILASLIIFSNDSRTENMDYSSPEELESRIGEAIMQIRTVCRDF